MGVAAGGRQPSPALQRSITWSLKRRLICKVSPGQRGGGSKGLEGSTCQGTRGTWRNRQSSEGRRWRVSKARSDRDLAAVLENLNLRVGKCSYGLCLFPFAFRQETLHITQTSTLCPHVKGIFCLR